MLRKRYTEEIEKLRNEMKEEMKRILVKRTNILEWKEEREREKEREREREKRKTNIVIKGMIWKEEKTGSLLART